MPPLGPDSPIAYCNYHHRTQSTEQQFTVQAAVFFFFFKRTHTHTLARIYHF